ncbi:hypothetical protein R3P38DRAFT_3533188 [Favolaschia claudopus]|uniref:Uncharacterized protein n=1 Tax=Favolaschia claudopus TaxID=2862362 RepID=A0AAW0BFQ1_9AGAR
MDTACTVVDAFSRQHFQNPTPTALLKRQLKGFDTRTGGLLGAWRMHSSAFFTHSDTSPQRTFSLFAPRRANAHGTALRRSARKQTASRCRRLDVLIDNRKRRAFHPEYSDSLTTTDNRIPVYPYAAHPSSSHSLEPTYRGCILITRHALLSTLLISPLPPATSASPHSISSSRLHSAQRHVIDDAPDDIPPYNPPICFPQLSSRRHVALKRCRLPFKYYTFQILYPTHRALLRLPHSASLPSTLSATSSPSLKPSPSLLPHPPSPTTNSIFPSSPSTPPSPPRQSRAPPQHSRPFPIRRINPKLKITTTRVRLPALDTSPSIPAPVRCPNSAAPRAKTHSAPKLARAASKTIPHRPPVPRRCRADSVRKTPR